MESNAVGNRPTGQPRKKWINAGAIEDRDILKMKKKLHRQEGLMTSHKGNLGLYRQERFRHLCV
jgi:glutaminase